MECPSCRAEVREDSKFCNQCGAVLPSECPSCGHSNVPNSKFCSECGVQRSAAGPAQPPAITIAAAAVPAPASIAERRQLTVMFVDLVGSTALSSRLDPEDMGAILHVYQNTVAGEIARVQGHVAKLMGDGVLAYFGWPRAGEDDAEHSVRAG